MSRFIEFKNQDEKRITVNVDRVRTIEVDDEGFAELLFGDGEIVFLKQKYEEVRRIILGQ